MDINEIVKDAQDRVEALRKQAKDVVDAALAANKQAVKVVTTTATKLADTETAAAKDLLEVAKASFEKARTAGIKEVAAAPADYIPEGKDRAIKAYEDTVKLLSKGQGDLVKAAKKGRDGVQKAVAGKKPVAKKAATAAKKATTTAKKRTTAAAKKVAAAA